MVRGRLTVSGLSDEQSERFIAEMIRSGYSFTFDVEREPAMPVQQQLTPRDHQKKHSSSAATPSQEQKTVVTIAEKRTETKEVKVEKKDDDVEVKREDEKKQKEQEQQSRERADNNAQPNGDKLPNTGQTMGKTLTKKLEKTECTLPPVQAQQPVVTIEGNSQTHRSKYIQSGELSRQQPQEKTTNEKLQKQQQQHNTSVLLSSPPDGDSQAQQKPNKEVPSHSEKPPAQTNHMHADKIQTSAIVDDKPHFTSSDASQMQKQLSTVSSVSKVSLLQADENNSLATTLENCSNPASKASHQLERTSKQSPHSLQQTSLPHGNGPSSCFQPLPPNPFAVPAPAKPPPSPPQSRSVAKIAKELDDSGGVFVDMIIKRETNKGMDEQSLNAHAPRMNTKFHNDYTLHPDSRIGAQQRVNNGGGWREAPQQTTAQSPSTNSTANSFTFTRFGPPKYDQPFDGMNIAANSHPPRNAHQFRK